MIVEEAMMLVFFFQAEDGIRDGTVTGVQTCALPIWPQWLEPSPATSSLPPGAYVAAPMALSRERIQIGAPDDRKHDLIPGSWFEAWSTAALATDPVGSRQNPPVLRSPAGVSQDRQEFWRQGKPYYNPQMITAPTLIAVAEWDRAT